MWYRPECGGDMSQICPLKTYHAMERIYMNDHKITGQLHIEGHLLEIKFFFTIKYNIGKIKLMMWKIYK